MKIILIALLLPVISFAQEKKTTVALLDSAITLQVPSMLKPMSDQLFQVKYHSSKKPALVLSDKDAEINLLGDMTNQPIQENQVGEYKDFRVTNLQKTRTDVKIIDQGVKTVNGHKFGFIKFQSQALDQKMFNYYCMVVVKEKLLLFTFNCTETLQPKWEKLADDMFASIIIK